MSNNRCPTCGSRSGDGVIVGDGWESACPDCAKPAAKEPGVRRWDITRDEADVTVDYVLASDHDSAVAALAAQVEALTVERDGLIRDSLQQTIDARVLRKAEIDKLTAENAALKADAARYRWLREFRSPVTFEPFIAVHGAGGFSQWVGEGADAAVDAAMEKQP